MNSEDIEVKDKLFEEILTSESNVENIFLSKEDGQISEV